MSTTSKRMVTAARQAPVYVRAINPFQRNTIQASNRWICTHCSYGKLRSRGPEKKALFRKIPIGRQLTHQRNTHQRNHERAFSSSASCSNEDRFRSDLPSAEEGRRSHASKRFDHLMDNIQSNIFIAGQRLNDLTGYSGIEALRKEIEQQERFVQDARTSLQRAREAYTKAISQRSASQREVNELLQRKHAWSPTDLERFTELYRSDHANEQAESAAQQQLVEVERTAEEAAALLSKSILSRYHEEQIWSDKIRRMSTWGTWGLMGVNVLLFLIFQIGVEPWRRKRLVQGFEEKVMEALEREGQPELRLRKTSLIAPEGKEKEYFTEAAAADPSGPAEGLLTSTPSNADGLQELDGIEPSAELASNSASLWASPAETLDHIVKQILDLFSDEQMTVRRMDVTAAAVEGAAAGVALTGFVLLLLRPR